MSDITPPTDTEPTASIPDSTPDFGPQAEEAPAWQFAPESPDVAPPTPATPAERRSVSIPTRWLVTAGIVVGSIALLALAFGVGVKVGAHTRFYGGPAFRSGADVAQFPRGTNVPYGWRERGTSEPDGWGYRNAPGYGGRGRGAPGVSPSPDASTTP